MKSYRIHASKRQRIYSVSNSCAYRFYIGFIIVIVQTGGQYAMKTYQIHLHPTSCKRGPSLSQFPPSLRKQLNELATPRLLNGNDLLYLLDEVRGSSITMSRILRRESPCKIKDTPIRCPYLFHRAEDVGIILLKATNSRKSTEGTRQLVSMQDTEICHTQWQFTPRSRSMVKHDTEKERNKLTENTMTACKHLEQMQQFSSKKNSS